MGIVDLDDDSNVCVCVCVCVCVRCAIDGKTQLRELVDLESIDGGTSRDRISELGLRRKR